MPNTLGYFVILPLNAMKVLLVLYESGIKGKTLYGYYWHTMFNLCLGAVYMHQIIKMSSIYIILKRRK